MKKSATPFFLRPFALAFMFAAIGSFIGYKVGFNQAVEKMQYYDQSLAPIIHEVEYLCTSNKRVVAQFSDGQVQITLPDSRAYTLPQTAAASGAKYANEGDKIVFWTKGNTAFVQENKQTTFDNCVSNAGEAPYENGDMIACTMDAKLCPDGSSVGRVGPNCEFAACPAE